MGDGQRRLLDDRHLVDGDRLTVEGVELRRSIEGTTDRLAGRLLEGWIGRAADAYRQPSHWPVP